MLANKIPALGRGIVHYRVESWPGNNNFPFRYVRIWGRWDNCEDDKLMWTCDERDFRKLAILYLRAWFVQDIVQATWRRIFRRG